MLSEPVFEFSDKLVGIFRRRIPAGFYIVQHLFDQIGAGEEGIAELLCHHRTAVPYELENILFSGGHTIAGEAANGEEAVAKYKELKPDLVTMDVVMPKVNGIEALKAIKQLDPAARVVMCTAVGQEQMVKLAIKTGAKGYIVKPFQAPKVLEEIKNVLAS